MGLRVIHDGLYAARVVNIGGSGKVPTKIVVRVVDTMAEGRVHVHARATRLCDHKIECSVNGGVLSLKFLSSSLRNILSSPRGSISFEQFPSSDVRTIRDCEKPVMVVTLSVKNIERVNR